MRILGAQDGSGCGYYRMIVPLRELARHGHDVTIVEQGKDDVTGYLRRSDEYDVIVGERLAGYDGLPIWRSARNPKNRLVYENDDDVFSITQENWVAFSHFNKKDVAEAVRAYSETADLVTVTTETLAQIFRGLNPNVAVLPNCVPASAFEVPPAKTWQRKRIGWVGGSSHGRDIHTATPSVRRFIQRFPEWDLYLGGTDFRASFKVPVDRAVYEPWHQVNEDEDLYFSNVGNFDIGIAPLLETDFVRSKSAIKCIEYGARGIPVIASDVTPYRSYIEDGYNGFLVKTDHEWLSRLSELASDEDLRLKMGENARTVARRFTIEDNWQRWEAAYEGLWQK